MTSMFPDTHRLTKKPTKGTASPARRDPAFVLLPLLYAGYYTFH